MEEHDILFEIIIKRENNINKLLIRQDNKNKNKQKNIDLKSIQNISIDTIYYLAITFKDKSIKHEDNVNMALMDYPVLMASDILLYQADLVPVGADQKQHLELTRDLAERFNNRFGETFKIPEPYISGSAARIMSLSEPDRKMSKSDANLNSFVSMNDEPSVIIKKFKRAVTDSDNRIIVSPEKPGITNLINIYAAFTEKTISEVEKEFEGKMYGEFKIAVGEAVADIIEPIRQEKIKLLSDKTYLDSVLKNGADRAKYLAMKTLSKVYKKVGLVPPVRG